MRTVEFTNKPSQLEMKNLLSDSEKIKMLVDLEDDFVEFEYQAVDAAYSVHEHRTTHFV